MGEFVPSQIEGPNDHSGPWERLGHVAIPFVLLLLAREGIPAHDEEFGAEQSYTLRTVALGLFGLPGKIQIGSEGNGLSVLGFGLQGGDLVEIVFPLPQLDFSAPEDRPLLFLRDPG